MGSRAIHRRLALGLAMLTAAGLLVVAAPGDARAAAHCPGRKMRTLPFSTGSVVVYKRGGYLCAVTLAKKPGTKRKMSVSIRRAAAVRWSTRAATSGTPPGHRARRAPLRLGEGQGGRRVGQLRLDPVLSARPEPSRDFRPA